MSNIAQAQPSINTLLKVGDKGSVEKFHTVANVGDLSGLTLSANVVDVTSHSTDVPWRQKIVTLLDAGDLTLPLYFVPSSGEPAGDSDPMGHDFTNGLGSIFTARERRNYKLVFPDEAETTWAFEAYISKFTMKASVAGVLEATVTFVATGQPNLGGA